MPQYIALLRGINVGGHRIKMDQLRELFEEVDLEDVSTFIASGNVIFSTGSEDAIALEKTIEEHLERELGYEVATFIRTPAELAAISRPHASGTESPVESSTSHYVIFLKTLPPASLRMNIADLNSETDAFEFSGREVHWRIQGKMSESPLFGGGLDRAIRGVPTTARNMNTLRRMVAKTKHTAGS